MTKEEAAKMIKDDMRLHHDYLSGEYRKALKIAIKALEETEIIYCKECKHRGEKPIADGRYWCEIHDTFMYYCSDAERREPMKKVIYLEDAINEIARWIGYLDKDMISRIQIGLERLPTAQLEIIRCKDCKYRMPYDWMFSETWRSRNIDDYSEDEIGCKYCDMTMKADDFCSRVERRNDDKR